MKRKYSCSSIFIFMGLLLCGPAMTCLGQAQTPAKPAQSVKRINATRESLAITYPEGKKVKVELAGTFRLPMAHGEARITREKGSTRIEANIENAKPAYLFGGDYSTYILWTVSPEGIVDNAGEFILENGHSNLNVSTQLETFGMFVTAEPHFLVSSPSRFVVLENTRPLHNISGDMLKVAQIQYRGFEGVYECNRETLANMGEVKGEVRPDLREASVAINLAVEAHAATYARNELEKAQEAYRKTDEAVHRNANVRDVMLLGHEAVRLAVEAQRLAGLRESRAALDSERKTHADEIVSLAKSAAAAQADAELERLEVEKSQLQLNEERHAAEAMREVAEGENIAARSAIEQEREQGQAREQAHTRLLYELNQVVDTRETSNSLIVTVPGAFFDSHTATLKPEGRAVLSRIGAILRGVKGYTLTLEGHTDNTNDDAHALKLSTDRAEAVRDCLVAEGISPSLMAAQGYGKSYPLASNATAEGRQKNRRVEIVIQEAELFSSSLK